MPSSLWTVFEPQSTLPVVTSRFLDDGVAVVDDGGPSRRMTVVSSALAARTGPRTGRPRE